MKNFITKDTIIFENKNITITADDVKLNIDTSFPPQTEISIFVDVSKYYKIQYHHNNRYRNRKLLLIGVIYNNNNNNIELPFFKFFDENCVIKGLELLGEDGYSSFFCSNCSRCDIYKNYPSLANTNSFLREACSNYDSINSEYKIERINILLIYNNIVNIVKAAFSPTRFNNKEFVYKVYDYGGSFAYEYLISRKQVHIPYKID